MVGRPKKKVTKVGNTRTVSVTLKSVFMSSEFLQGWKSYKKGLPLDPDACASKHSFHYERGRMFAALHPEIKVLREGLKPNQISYYYFKKAWIDRSII